MGVKRGQKPFNKDFSNPAKQSDMYKLKADIFQQLNMLNFNVQYSIFNAEFSTSKSSNSEFLNFRLRNFKFKFQCPNFNFYLHFQLDSNSCLNPSSQGLSRLQSVYVTTFSKIKNLSLFTLRDPERNLRPRGKDSTTSTLPCQ